MFNEPEECIAAGSKSGSIRVFDLEQNKGQFVLTVTTV